jgi:flagellar biosynthesis protein FlhB
MSGDAERTLDPTPARRQKFRKEGRIAKSRDAGAIAATAAVLAILVGTQSTIWEVTRRLFSRTLGDVGSFSRGEAYPVFQAALTTFATIAAPAAIGAVVLGVAIGGAQAGFRIEPSLVDFKPERFDPIGRLKQMFAFQHAAIESAMSVLRVSVVGYVGYRALMIDLPDLLTLGHVPTSVGFSRVVQCLAHVVTVVLVALVAIAAIDYFQSRYQLEQSMKMTRQEVMDEQKQDMGNPKLRARMRQRGRAMIKKMALANVKSATVVVTNPTHVAVALRYSERDAAPVVVAKGHDHLALQIRALARRYGVPIIENRSLARSLDAEVNIGKIIPAAHYNAVARILAFVYNLRGGNARRRRVQPSQTTTPAR